MSESKTDFVSSPSTMNHSGTKIQDIFSTYTLSAGEYQTIQKPKYTWKCELYPGTYWNVEDHRVPNWFHRKMQQLCFGIKWSKIK